MKKLLTSLFVCGALVASVCQAYAAEDELLTAPLTAKNTYSVVVGNDTLDLENTSVYQSGKHYMIPVRKVAEKLGFKVEWNETDRGIFLDNGEVNTTIHIGTDSYYMASSKAIGMSAPTALGAAPEIKDSVTYVPAEMFGVLYCNSNAVSFKDGTITIQPNPENGKDENTQIPNPWTEYSSIAEAEAALSFRAKLPQTLPQNYQPDYIAVLSDNFLQVVYKNGNDEINYRTAKETGDISGDYNVYQNKKTAKINGYEVSLRGNENVANATWADGDIAYSIYANKELTEAEITKIISSISPLRS